VLPLACRWVRLGGELDLLDAPGIIPAAFNDQAAAQALAICNDIGEASYVDSLIAAAMIIRIKALPRNRCAPGCARSSSGQLVWGCRACKLECHQLAAPTAVCRRLHRCCF
jgi:hypothetical protein